MTAYNDNNEINLNLIQSDLDNNPSNINLERFYMSKKNKNKYKT